MRSSRSDKPALSVVLITNNSEELLEKSLSSVKGLADEIVVADSYSSDKTLEILKKFKAQVYQTKGSDLGKKRAFGLARVKNNWVLSLDADESVSVKLKEEIISLLTAASDLKNGYLIPFQNHYLQQPVSYGGENYKMLRLFKKNSVVMESALVHEGFRLKNGIPGELKNKILHYSYRSIPQMYAKFTDYALREAKQKRKNGEKTSLKKIFLYAPHMFWARFIKDQGYKDGFFRIPLDLGFAYMELLTYVAMLFIKPNKI